MICPECHGKGMHLSYEHSTADCVCSMCGGHGVVHCCEGDQEQPAEERLAAPQPRCTGEPAPTLT